MDNKTESSNSYTIKIIPSGEGKIKSVKLPLNLIKYGLGSLVALGVLFVGVMSFAVYASFTAKSGSAEINDLRSVNSIQQEQLLQLSKKANALQDEMQELNKQRQEATQYIEGIVEAIIWFSNQFNGTTWSLDEEICVEFDDSYVEDKVSKLEQMRADALSFPEVKEFTIQYVMARLNCEREEAISYIDGTDPDADDEPED